MRLMKNVICVMALLLIGTNVFANFWKGVADPNAGGLAKWSIAKNWSPATVPVAGEKTQLADNYPEAVIDYPGAVCGQLVVGDNGANIQNKLRIASGGVLNASTGVTGDAWSAAGYNRSGNITVDSGGELISGKRFGVGMVAAATPPCVSTLTVNGGLVHIYGNLQPGITNHKGIVYVKKGGLLEATGWEWRGTPGVWCLIDIQFGSVVIGGNVTAAIPGYVTAGGLTAFGGLGTVVYDYNVSNPGKTTITAVDPMNRAPMCTTVLAGNLNLTWTNLAPIAPATDVWVDVYFGPDPNMLSPLNTKVVSKGKNVTTAPVTAPLVTEPTTYYWRIDSYRNGDPTIVVYDPNIGAVTPFDVTANVAPVVVINTPPTATWINQPIQLDSTLTDDGTTPVTYLWTSDDPNAVFTPSATVADPAVSVNWNTGPFTVTVTVNDGSNPPSIKRVTHYCAKDACQAALEVFNLHASHPGDIVVDCEGNLTDFAAIARQWLTNYTLTDPIPIP
jgi:hypothetical protein